ncbi:uncharacterized protein LOC141914966 [Tubulanus polymorphus]|uniref:uncharacterized protein LOC141914966 n=1 Tax=Tubulanus polymorphus TaxID=672921 RepID=UPI003DA43A5B
MDNVAYNNEHQGYAEGGADEHANYYNQQQQYGQQYGGYYGGQGGHYNGGHYAPNPNYNRQYSSGPSYGGSKHSLASARDTKSMISTTSTRTVQAQYRDHRAQKKINSWYFGPGKRQMHIAIGLIVAALVCLLIFGTLMGLWRHARLHWSERVEFVPYLFLILALLLFGVAGRFVWEARKQSTLARRNVAYKADGADNVRVVDKKEASARSQENLRSGTYSQKAVGSTPNTTLNSIALSMDRSYMNRTMDRSTTKSLPSLDRSYAGDEDADSRRGDVF